MAGVLSPWPPWRRLDRIDNELRELRLLLEAIRDQLTVQLNDRRKGTLMATLDDIIAEVHAEHDQNTAVAALIVHLVDEVQKADNGTDPAALDKVLADMKANSDILAAAALSDPATPLPGDGGPTAPTPGAA